MFWISYAKFTRKEARVRSHRESPAPHASLSSPLLIRTPTPQPRPKLGQHKGHTSAQHAQTPQQRTRPLRPQPLKHLHRKQGERPTEDISQHGVGRHRASAVHRPVRVGHVHHARHEDEHVAKPKQTFCDGGRQPVDSVCRRPAVSAHVVLAWILPTAGKFKLTRIIQW